MQYQIDTNLAVSLCIRLRRGCVRPRIRYPSVAFGGMILRNCARFCIVCHIGPFATQDGIRS